MKVVGLKEGRRPAPQRSVIELGRIINEGTEIHKSLQSDLDL